MFDALIEPHVSRKFGALHFAMIVASAICATLPSVAMATECDTVHDPVVYASITGLTPDDATPAWNVGCGDAFYLEGTIASGLLHVEDASSGSATCSPSSTGCKRVCYTRSEVFDCANQDAVFEAVLKTTSGSTSFHEITNIVAVFGFSDGGETMTLVITPEAVGFWDLTVNGKVKWLDDPGALESLDTTDAMHCYRVGKHSKSTVQLFVDGCEVVEWDYGALMDAPLRENKAYLVATSTGGTALCDVMSFRYRIGATSFPDDQGSPNADLNADYVVNTVDLGILLSAWTLPPATSCSGSACNADLNDDNVVNTLDLGILLASWTCVE